MTLEEAIKHAEEVASEYRNTMVCGFNSTGTLVALPENDCIKCAEDHEQLAEWLKELKAYKECYIIKSECGFCGNCKNAN